MHVATFARFTKADCRLTLEPAVPFTDQRGRVRKGDHEFPVDGFLSRIELKIFRLAVASGCACIEA